MPTWLRNLTMITGLAGWGATVAAYIAQGQLPDALLLGVPAGLILALAPPVKLRVKPNNDEEDESKNAGTGSDGGG